MGSCILSKGNITPQFPLLSVYRVLFRIICASPQLLLFFCPSFNYGLFIQICLHLRWILFLFCLHQLSAIHQTNTSDILNLLTVLIGSTDNKVRELIAVKVLHTSLLNTTVVAFKLPPLGSYAPMPAPSPSFKTILELVL